MPLDLFWGGVGWSFPSSDNDVRAPCDIFINLRSLELEPSSSLACIGLCHGLFQIFIKIVTSGDKWASIGKTNLPLSQSIPLGFSILDTFQHGQRVLITKVIWLSLNPLPSSSFGLCHGLFWIFYPRYMPIS